MRVLIGLGGVLTALLGALWALFALIAASPCGLEGGGGLLRGSSRCPVQAGNVASALVAAPGLVVVGVATVLALLYALTGRTRFVEGVRRAWLIIAAIALLWIILVGILPSPSVNNSSRDGEHIRFADVRVGVFLNVAVTLRPHGLEFRPLLWDARDLTGSSPGNSGWSQDGSDLLVALVG